MQYGHCVVSATATAINSLYLRGMTPSLNAASSKARNPLNASGASSPSFFIFDRFFMSYIVISLMKHLSPAAPAIRTGQGEMYRPEALPNTLFPALGDLRRQSEWAVIEAHDNSVSTSVDCRPTTMSALS